MNNYTYVLKGKKHTTLIKLGSSQNGRIANLKLVIKTRNSNNYILIKRWNSNNFIFISTGAKMAFGKSDMLHMFRFRYLKPRINTIHKRY